MHNVAYDENCRVLPILEMNFDGFGECCSLCPSHLIWSCYRYLVSVNTLGFDRTLQTRARRSSLCRLILRLNNRDRLIL